VDITIHEEATTEMMQQMRAWLAEFPQLRLLSVLVKGWLNDTTRHQALINLKVEQDWSGPRPEDRNERIHDPLGDGSRGGLRGCAQVVLLYAMLKGRRSPPQEAGICLLQFFLWCRSFPDKKYQIYIGKDVLFPQRLRKTGDLELSMENSGQFRKAWFLSSTHLMTR
jgi:hypothetical protein